MHEYIYVQEPTYIISAFVHLVTTNMFNELALVLNSKFSKTV